MGKIVEDTPHDFVRLKLDTDFPSRLARGQDRAGLVLMQPKVHVGKMMSADVENPGALEGGRRRRRKTTRRHRKRKTTRRR